MSFVHKRHDIGFLRQDGTTKVPMMLARKNDAPIYQTSDLEYILDPIRGESRVDRELKILEDDWRGGFGQEIADTDFPDRYHYGTNIDARFKNEVRCGPLATSITKPTITAATLTDGGLEAWDDANTLTNWTQAGGNITQGGTIRSGTYSMKDNSAAAIDQYQDVSFNNEWQGRTFTLRCWVFPNAATTMYLTLDDNVTTKDSAKNAGSAAWEQLEVTMTLDGAATRLRLRLREDANAATASYFDDVTLVDPTAGAITAQADFVNERYVAYGNVLMRLNATGTALQYVHSFPEDITYLYPTAISGVDYLFVCLGWGQACWYMLDTLIEDCEDVWIELVDGDVTATADTTDYEKGTASLSLEVAAGCAAGDILATETIASTNLSTYQWISMRVKSTTALNAADIQLLLDDSAKCATPLNTLDLPAIAADTWTDVLLPLESVSTLTAIISVGIEMNVDKNAFTLNIDEIRALSSVESTLTDNKIKQMAIVGATLWGSDTNSTIKYTANPINGGTNWTAGKQVGDDAHDIVDLAEYGGLLYIKKTDRPYYKDGSGNIQVLTNETEHLGGNNDQLFYIWHDYLLMPYGEQGLLAYDGTYLTWISPSLYSTGAGDFVGEVRALAGDDHYLYAVLDDGADVQLMATRRETVGGTTDWRWHPLAELTIAGCASVGITSIYKKRIYIGSTSSGNNFTWYPVTTKYGDIDNDTDYKYQTNGYLYSSWLHGGYKADLKAFIKQTLAMSHAYDADIDFTVHYRLWGTTTWVSVGVFDGASGVRTESQYIDIANKPSSTLIQFRTQFITDDTAKTPILNSNDVRAILYPVRQNIIKCVVHCADDMTDKFGNELEVNAATIRATLDEAKNDATYLVTFYDIFGETKTVRLLSVDPYSVVTSEEKGRNPEQDFMLVMQEVTNA